MTVIIIGGGHNGLTAAFYLAKAGFKPIVLEQSEMVGGGAITRELHPGFRCPALAHHTTIRADIARDMQLTRHGVEYLPTPVDVFAPGADGTPVIVYADADRTAQVMRSVHAGDAGKYRAYQAAMDAVCDVLAPMLTSQPPDIDDPDARDLWNLLKTGRRFRGLVKRDAYRLLRWISMPVADFASEWFETEALRALVCARGVSGTMFGPRSAGSALVLLLERANRRLAAASSPVRGGPGALAQAMAAAARAAGADIQTGTRVERVIIRDDRATGVVAAGREIAAAAVVSAVDPKTTFLQLVDAGDLSPDFLAKVRGYRATGALAKVNLALAALPQFAGPVEGRIHIGPTVDYLERAFDHVKYGELSAEPWLDVTIPSVLDTDLAPAGAHVMSIYAHYAPYRIRDRHWADAKDVLLKRVLAVLDRYAPGIQRLVVAAEVISPPELESQYGIHGGHIFHGELSLDQLVSLRPVIGYGRYRSPVRGLFVCGAGTHPGGFMSGASGRLAAGHVVRSRPILR